MYELQQYVDKRRCRARGPRQRAAGWRRCGVPHLRPGDRPAGIPPRQRTVACDGYRQLEQTARTAGDSDMVVSATPSENTVRLYLGRGFQPMADPLAELFELEPEDVHMRKRL